MGVSPSLLLDATFTVIHRGTEIDEDAAGEVVDAATAWTDEARPGSRLVVVWAAPWNRFVFSCLATVAAFGGPVGHLHLPVADDVVARINARGITVRHRQARRSAVVDAELRAISQGWPVRYL